MAWILQCNFVLQGMPARALPSSLEHGGGHLKTSKFGGCPVQTYTAFLPSVSHDRLPDRAGDSTGAGLGGQSLFPFPQFPSGCSLGVPSGSACCPGVNWPQPNWPTAGGTAELRWLVWMPHGVHAVLSCSLASWSHACVLCAACDQHAGFKSLKFYLKTRV